MLYFSSMHIQDESEWETVVDFTTIDDKGVPLNKVLKALQEE